jgi:hypothetical protein
VTSVITAQVGASLEHQKLPQLTGKVVSLSLCTLIKVTLGQYRTDVEELDGEYSEELFSDHERVSNGMGLLTGD